MFTLGGLIKFEVKNFDLYNFMFNGFSINFFGNVMDENLNPKVEVKGSSPRSCNL
jgi:hypothetical protein